MKSKLMVMGALVAFTCLTAEACKLPIRVACPNGTTAAGIRVVIPGAGEGLTDSLGMVEIELPWWSEYDICVDTTTLPAGSFIRKPCIRYQVDSSAPPVLEFVLDGPFCEKTPPPGPCWLTGGGTVGKVKGVPEFTFGGVVYPGCSPKAADGGNWNVVDHATYLHFQGTHIVVDKCSGVSTKSPRVNVNIIDFHGYGILGAVGGNAVDDIVVSFVGRAVDNLESGSGSDLLYLKVLDSSNNTMMQVGASADNPAVISTGNLQIHTTSCN